MLTRQSTKVSPGQGYPHGSYFAYIADENVGSEEEIEDVIEAYEKHNGSLPKLMEEIPHSQYTDEARLIKLINDLISDKKLSQTPLWKRTSTDEKARSKREKAASKSAKEAEAHAKELGVWDEFYGDGKKGKRKSDARDKDEGGGTGGEDALAALILRRQKDREGGLDRLAEKYARIEEEERAKKKGKKANAKGKKGEKEEVDRGAQKVSQLSGSRPLFISVVTRTMLTGLGTERCRL